MLFLLPRCALQNSKRQPTYRSSSLKAFVKYKVRRLTSICSHSNSYTRYQLKFKKVCQIKSLLLQSLRLCSNTQRIYLRKQGAQHIDVNIAKK